MAAEIQAAAVAPTIQLALGDPLLASPILSRWRPPIRVAGFASPAFSEFRTGGIGGPAGIRSPGQNKQETDNETRTYISRLGENP